MSNVHGGGETVPALEECIFGLFGIIQNVVGDCRMDCPAGKFKAQINYGDGDICCCN